MLIICQLVGRWIYAIGAKFYYLLSEKDGMQYFTHLPLSNQDDVYKPFGCLLLANEAGFRGIYQ